MELTLEIPDTLTAKFAALGFDDPLNGLYAATKLLVGLGPEAWTTVTQLSDAQGISPAKVILQKLNAPEPTGEATAAPAKRRTTKTDNSQRDAQIWELARTGSTHAKIAAEHGLSVIRVSQIVALQRARSLRLDAPQNT